MAITPPRRPQSVEEFIGSAPDAGRSSSPTPSTAAPAGSSPVALAGQAVAVAPAANQAARRRPGLKRGRREQISHTIDPDLLERVDRHAREMGQTRAGFINMAIFKAVHEADKL